MAHAPDFARVFDNVGHRKVPRHRRCDNERQEQLQLCNQTLQEKLLQHIIQTPRHANCSYHQCVHTCGDGRCKLCRVTFNTPPSLVTLLDNYSGTPPGQPLYHAPHNHSGTPSHHAPQHLQRCIDTALGATVARQIDHVDVVTSIHKRLCTHGIGATMSVAVNSAWYGATHAGIASQSSGPGVQTTTHATVICM